MNNGIYKIENLINGKVYIGYTSNFRKRFNSHKCLLRNNKHENEYLQKSWNKYTESNFCFIVLEICEKSEFIKKEHFWVEYYKSNDRKFGYNIAITGVGFANSIGKESIQKAVNTRRKNAEIRGYWYSKETIEKQVKSRLGWRHTEEAKEKIKIASTNRKMSKESIDKKNEKIIKPVLQYSKLGNFIKEFRSIKEALLFINKNEKEGGHISECCKGKRNTAFGFKWEYKNEKSINFISKKKKIIIKNTESNIEYTIKELSKFLNLKEHTLYTRLRKNNGIFENYKIILDVRD